MLREEKRGLVLNGVALLLILPALLLSASFLTAVKIGGEGTTVKAISDKVSYMSYNYKTTLSYMENIGVSLDNETLQKIKKAYERSTGTRIEKVEVGIFDIWENIHETLGGDESYPHYAWGKWCEIKKGPDEDSWYYSFEDLDPEYNQEPDEDRNEARLLVEKLSGNEVRITVEAYGGSFVVDVWLGDRLLWEDVNDDPTQSGLQGIMDPDEGLHVGENQIVSSPPRLFFLKTESPGNIAIYRENFSVG